MRVHCGKTELTYKTQHGLMQRVILFECDLDLRVLSAMARKAVASKGQKSVDGPITVSIVGTVDNLLEGAQ